jgi:hypothetical protein
VARKRELPCASPQHSIAIADRWIWRWHRKRRCFHRNFNASNSLTLFSQD